MSADAREPGSNSGSSSENAESDASHASANEAQELFADRVRHQHIVDGAPLPAGAPSVV